MYSEIIYNLTKQLFPTGRAFRIADDSVKAKLQFALSVSESQAYEDALAVLNSILPDNDQFDEADATDWERRLGMISSDLVSLPDRMLAIARKYAAPGSQPARGHYLFIERQLQAAGFNVFVYENRFPDYPSGWITMTPLEVCGDPSILSEWQHGSSVHGISRHGIHYNNIIANSLDASVDASFNLGGTYRCTFFIGGTTLGSFAAVPFVREQEFRELILKLKQVQDIGFLFINYVL